MSPEGQVHGITQDIVEFVQAHEMWAAPIVGALAFGESLAFVSLVLPAWAVLVALGALIAQGGISFWPVWIAGAVGAALGDWLSYWIGTKLGPAVGHIWPLARHPDLIPRGERFVTRWGALAIFIGRFSGPLRAVVPRGRHLLNAILAFPNRQFRFPFRMGGDAAHAGGCCGKDIRINMAVNLGSSPSFPVCGIGSRPAYRASYGRDTLFGMARASAEQAGTYDRNRRRGARLVPAVVNEQMHCKRRTTTCLPIKLDIG